MCCISLIGLLTENRVSVEVCLIVVVTVLLDAPLPTVYVKVELVTMVEAPTGAATLPEAGEPVPTGAATLLGAGAPLPIGAATLLGAGAPTPVGAATPELTGNGGALALAMGAAEEPAAGALPRGTEKTLGEETGAATDPVPTGTEAEELNMGAATDDVPAAEGAEDEAGAAATGVVEPSAAVTGQNVVVTKTSDVTTVSWVLLSAGQSVTVGAQLVTVKVEVVKKVDVRVRSAEAVTLLN